MVRFGSLFAGIGGFDLGLEAAGWESAWQVELDPDCRQVLAEHWPTVRRHDDVRTFPPTSGNWGVDWIVGGFPCQDISNAGKREGITGERSGLWSEFIRIVRHLRPYGVIVENVAALLARGMDTVLGDLAACGMDAEWDVLPAFPFGAPSNRERVFIVAYPQRGGLEGRVFGCAEPRTIEPPANRGTSLGTYVGETWGHEPQISLLDDGLSGSLAEFSSRATGNAVVPQVVEWIGRRINHELQRQRDDDIGGQYAAMELIGER